MTWSARPVSDVPGVYHLLRDGDVVGGITFLPEAGWRVDMLVADAVRGLNHPQTLDERGGFGGPPDMLAQRRAARAGHPSAS